MRLDLQRRRRRYSQQRFQQLTEHMDIAQLTHAESALAATAEFVSAPTRPGFCEEFVQHCALTLGLDYVHIARLVPGQHRVETDAAWLDGKPIANWSYDLAGTPCEEVMLGTRRCIQSGVSRRFPADEDLQRLGAEGYVGEPVLNTAGKVLGLVVGVTREPLRTADLIQANLRILATRAGAEFEQRLAMRTLCRERDTIRNILQTVEAIIVALDNDGRITLINRRGCELLGYSEDELIGQDWFSTCLPPDAGPDSVRRIHCGSMIGNLADAEYVEHPIRTRDGQQRLIAWRNGRLLDPDGATIGSLCAGEDITERRLAERQLTESELQYRTLADSGQALIWAAGTDRLCYYFNRVWLEFTGRSMEQEYGNGWTEGVHPDDMERCVDIYVSSFDRRARFSMEYRLRRHDGEYRWLQDDGSPRYDSSGAFIGYIGYCLDITPAHQAREDMVRKRQYQQALFDNFPFMIWLKDPEGRFLAVNQAFADAVQAVSTDAVVGMTDSDVWPPEQAQRYRADDRAVLMSRQKMQIEEEIVEQGEPKWFETFKAPVVDAAGDLLGTVGFSRDISDRKETEEQIRQLAYFDPLTGLPNRRLLLDRLNHALIASNRSRQYGALLMLDLDHFKALNDTRGHDVGDRLLIEVARRITATLREEDTVSRLGGDEYVVMLEGLGRNEETAANEAELIAEKLRQAVNAPYDLPYIDQAHYCTPSIGLTLFRGMEDSVEVLLKQADVALYQAKDAGRDSVRFFNPAMQTAIESRIALEGALRQAICKGELLLFYQPQIDQDGRCVGAEALLRWRRPEYGLVPPLQFVPLAEETGLILPIGRWVVDTACAQLKAWESDPRTRSLQLAINVSARQFHQSDFVAQVRESIERSGANPERLKLELTESVVLGNTDSVVERMQQLKALGLGFSMDDFGTGYSSLSYLKRLPLDQLKIDQSFVRDITTDPNDAAIVQAILAMSHSLGLQAIAEGVETEEQQLFLRENGCYAFQGYLFGKPMPIDDWPHT
jgi:diguanylate cyclase (GGDEF)-like protein/PAS domain S-box-containing protein